MEEEAGYQGKTETMVSALLNLDFFGNMSPMTDRYRIMVLVRWRVEIQSIAML